MTSCKQRGKIVLRYEIRVSNYLCVVVLLDLLFVLCSLPDLKSFTTNLDAYPSGITRTAA
jgi:hypothetical protein